MIRIVHLIAAAGLAALMAQPAMAQNTSKKDRDAKAAASRTAAAGGANLLGTFGDWSAYRGASGDNRVCFVLSQPTARAPKGLNRDPAYLYISFRPAAGIRNEVALITGYTMKEGAQPVASIGDASFGLVSTEGKAWLQNAAEESQFVQLARAGSSLAISGTSARGNKLTDTYSLKGLSQAVEAAQKGCR
jgi:hypothetical protein